MSTLGRKRKFDEAAEEVGGVLCNRVPDTPVDVDGIPPASAASGACRGIKRQRIVSYSEILKPGDVIFVWRPLGYKHYGVVSEVSHNYVFVVHYWSYGPKTEAIIRQDPIELFAMKEDGKVHVLDFSSKIVRMIYGAPLEAQTVVSKALRKLGRKGGKYSLLENNCEHFAIKCKTGRSRCWQSLKYKLAGGILFLSSLIYYAPIALYSFVIV